MSPFVSTIRAIGTTFAMRLYVPAAIIVAIIMALLVVVGLWLTTISTWWWLLFIPLTVSFCVVLAVASIILLLIRFVTPAQTKTQKQAVNGFVDRVQAITDVVGTPKIIILFRVVRSIASPRKDQFLSDLVANKELVNDFRELQRLFDT